MPTPRGAREGEFIIKYEIEDGYTGGSRPQSFRFNAEDFQPDMTDEQIESALYDAAHEDMLQKVNTAISNRDEFMAWARKQIETLANGEPERAVPEKSNG